MAALEITQAAVESAGALGALGVDGKLFLAQLVNFGLILLVMWRFAYRPLLRTMDERARKIAQGLKDADDAADATRDASAQREAIIAEARVEARRILEETETRAKTDRDEAARRAKEDVERIVREGKATLQSEREKAVESAKAELVDIVALAVERIAGERLDAKKDAALVKDAIAAAEKRV